MQIKFCLLFLLLFGCTTLQVPEEFRYATLKTPHFDFATWQKITDKSADYKVYIEGDGHAFNAHGMPTSDPTPHGTFVRELAFGDNHPNVIYMARACQFIQSSKCVQKYWTTARFAPEIIEAQAAAVKQLVGFSPVTLVGFSGGAQIAGLVAVLHPELNITKVITIAGNLDHKAWTKHHKVPPLDDSLDLNDYRDAFAAIEQIHYVGTDDEVMPPYLNRDFVTDKSAVIEIKGAGHNRGWSEIVPQIQAQ